MPILPPNVQQAGVLQPPEVLLGQTFTINIDLVHLAYISNPCSVYGVQQQMDGVCACSVYGVQQQMDGVCVCVCMYAQVNMSIQFS